jgi:hypothetical protein
MLRGLHKASTLIVLAVGAIHTAYTFFAYDSLNDSAVWFAGAGLCGIFVALLNMALWLPEAPALSRRSVAAANFLFFFWLVAGVTAVSGPMRLVVAGSGAAMVITAPLLGRGKRGEHGGMPSTAIQADAASPRG